MTTLALDWNATRIRAVLGASGRTPLPLPLEPPALELACAINLAKSAPEVGGAALRQCRADAHQTCQTFLPHVADSSSPGPRWSAGRHSIDARDACSLIWSKLRHFAADSQGIVMTTPAYLRAEQAIVLRKLAERARLRVLGSIPSLLSAALAAQAEHFWRLSVLVVDADDHAVSIGWVKSLGDKANLIECRTLPRLGLTTWRERLIDHLSDLFVWNHRRDPRDAPAAEQSLFDQLDALMDAAGHYQAIQLGVQGQQWYKHLLVNPDETLRACSPLVRQTASEAEAMLSTWPAGESPRSILLTHDAGRLPGLVDALRVLVVSAPAGETKLPSTKVTNYLDEDFGEALMLHEENEPGGILVLPPEAPARAAHGLAEWFRQGACPGGHIDTIAPLITPSMSPALPRRADVIPLQQPSPTTMRG